MTPNPSDDLDPVAGLRHRDEEASPLPPSLLGELCQLENLKLAHAQVKTDFSRLGINALILETVEKAGAEAFLQQLSHDLRARIYHPGRPSPASAAESVLGREDVIALRDQVVLAALQRLLDPLFSPALPCGPAPEKVIAWVARHIEQGLTRVFAVHLEGCLDIGQPERLLERAGRRIGDSEVLGLLREILAAAARPGTSEQGLPVTPLLANLAYEGIDQILRQANSLGREGNVVHCTCARFADDLVFLADADPRYDWVFPAVRQRLREELSRLHGDANPAQTQFVDLARGDKLRLLGFGLRRLPGSTRVQARRLQKSNRRASEATLRRWPLRWPFPRLELGRRCWNWAPFQRSRQLVQDGYRRASSVQVGFRHLPITLYPVLAFVVGWNSPIAWLCAVLIVVCNWRSLPAVGMQAWRHWPEVTMAACGLVSLICLGLLVSDLSANLSREEPVPNLPPGFYLGQYNKGSPWDSQFVSYGLYLPPHFQGQKGPFPLIVFLNPYGERTPGRLFQVGMACSIIERFGPGTPNSRFDFVAFFPIDTTGQWQAGTPVIEDTMQALDHVIRRHQIDPARVYLTGIANGGNGVWRLAEAYPERWAALAPVNPSVQPDVAKVRHLPVWIFQGIQDKQATVELEQALVQRLREARADVRYTKVPKQGRAVWRQVYDAKDLYDWFAKQKRAG